MDNETEVKEEKKVKRRRFEQFNNSLSYFFNNISKMAFNSAVFCLKLSGIFMLFLTPIFIGMAFIAPGRAIESMDALFSFFKHIIEIIQGTKS